MSACVSQGGCPPPRAKVGMQGNIQDGGLDTILGVRPLSVCAYVNL